MVILVISSSKHFNSDHNPRWWFPFSCLMIVTMKEWSSVSSRKAEDTLALKMASRVEEKHLEKDFTEGTIAQQPKRIILSMRWTWNVWWFSDDSLLSTPPHITLFLSDVYLKLITLLHFEKPLNTANSLELYVLFEWQLALTQVLKIKILLYEGKSDANKTFEIGIDAKYFGIKILPHLGFWGEIFSRRSNQQ